MCNGRLSIIVVYYIIIIVIVIAWWQGKWASGLDLQHSKYTLPEFVRYNSEHGIDFNLGIVVMVFGA